MVECLSLTFLCHKKSENSQSWSRVTITATYHDMDAEDEKTVGESQSRREKCLTQFELINFLPFLVITPLHFDKATIDRIYGTINDSHVYMSIFTCLI